MIRVMLIIYEVIKTMIAKMILMTMTIQITGRSHFIRVEVFSRVPIVV
jgi:hypothetical protein